MPLPIPDIPDASERTNTSSHPEAASPLRVLVLGGAGFIGRHGGIALGAAGLAAAHCRYLAAAWA